jgi:hypothetical protein
MHNSGIRVASRLLPLLLVALAACKTDDPANSKPRPPRPPQTIAGLSANTLILDQGWDIERVQKFWFTGQGSEMIPRAWVLALERPNGERFATPATFERYGYLPASKTTFNPDAWPVGFAVSKDPASGDQWLGYTCAGCHTGVLDYGGKRLVLTGGATLGNLSGLLGDLIDTLQTTARDEARLARFATAVLGANRNAIAVDQLRTGMLALANEMQVRKQGMVESGYGRLDAFGTIFNEVLAMELGLPNNQQFADAPVSYPFIWDASHMDRVQWNGAVSNDGPGPIGRNVAEIMGVFGRASIDRSRVGYASSMNVPNLGDLEMWLKHLWSPLWPEEILPALDRTKVARGKEHYAANCVSCHSVLTNRTDLNRKIIVTMVPVAEAGTDPRMAMNFAQRVAATGRLKGAKEYYLFGKKFGDTAPAMSILNNVVVGTMAAHPAQSFRAALKDYEGFYRHAKYDPITNPSYKARPLNGIWATAPYLHNGSVANLWDLLQPPDKRTRAFHVGNFNFDPVRVGYDMTATPTSSLFTATGTGNSNAGHLWGTELSETQKWELIEYLKSL